MTDDHFPNVRCTDHPHEAPAPGYAVCVHVLEAGAPIAHYHPATRRALGEVLCAACHDGSFTEHELRLICATCVDQLLAAAGAPPEDPRR